MSELTEQQKRKLMAAAEIVDKGQFAVLEKILEFMDYFDAWKDEVEGIRQNAEGFMPQQIQDKLEQISTDTTSMADMFREMKEKHAEMETSLENVCKNATEKSNVEIGKLKDRLISLFGEIKKMRNEIPEIPKETDLTDIYNRLVEVEQKIPKIPEEITPYQIIDKLEEIDNEKEKLRISAIQDLEKRLDELEKRPIGKGGGGTSAIGVARAFKYIAHTKQPTGVIDGVNLTYIVPGISTIWWIAGFTLNGENIAELPNFTYSGATITFASALPAAYSGKDFEVKLIGT